MPESTNSCNDFIEKTDNYPCVVIDQIDEDMDHCLRGFRLLEIPPRVSKEPLVGFYTLIHEVLKTSSDGNRHQDRVLLDQMACAV